MAEAAGKPVRALTLTASDITPVKTIALVVLSSELLRDLDGAGLAMLGRELRLSIATAGDGVLFTALSGNSAEAQGAPTWQGLIDDLTELARMVALGAGSRPYLIVAQFGKADRRAGLRARHLHAGVERRTVRRSRNVSLGFADSRSPDAR